MAKLVSEPKADDMLSIAIDAVVDGSFLLAPACPDPFCITLLHRQYGVCIVSLSASSTAPVASEAGAPEGFDADSLVRNLKKRLGRAAAALPVACACWYPEIPPQTLPPVGMTTASVIYGDDFDLLRDSLIEAMKEGSAPPGTAYSELEAGLRSAPGGRPAAPEQVKPVNVSVREGKPMAASDPMLLLITHAVNTVIGNSEAEIMNTSLTPMDISSPVGLLPVVLVIAAEEWGAADLASGGQGGFHVYLTTVKDVAGSITGYAVTDVKASSAVVMSLSITTTLKACKNAEDTFMLDALVSRFARFMETGGFTSVNMKRIQLALRSLGDE